MSLRWAGVARVLSQGFSTRPWPCAAGTHHPDPRAPPARDRCGRAWRGSTTSGGRPRRNIADSRPIVLAAAPFPGASPPPIKDNSFRGGDGASNRDGATRALVPVAVALLSLGCKEAPGRRPLPATWLKKSHFAGGECQLQALLRSVPADDHVPVAQNAADVTVARVCVCAGRTAGRNEGNGVASHMIR